jgi:2-polyprenyl-3-methyl-5-hydroxy-6-metoxy-1,4-benzoquinol methylase
MPNQETLGDDKQIEGVLTSVEDWSKYYEDRSLDEIERLAGLPSIIDDYLKIKNGKIFELGCGGSYLLARSAQLGWEVGGIDFNPVALNLIKTYLIRKGYRSDKLICNDIFI